jgi:hypothetical protein
LAGAVSVLVLETKYFDEVLYMLVAVTEQFLWEMEYQLVLNLGRNSFTVRIAETSETNWKKMIEIKTGLTPRDSSELPGAAHKLIGGPNEPAVRTD